MRACDASHAAAGSAANADASDTSPMAAQPRDRRRLLVIDDQAGVTRVVNLIASELGWEVRVVNDPTIATEAFIAFRPDTVILDMIMPEKDGIDVLNEILLTGLPSRLIVTSGLSAGFVRLARGVAEFHHVDGVTELRKPFRRADLLELLR